MLAQISPLVTFVAGFLFGLVGTSVIAAGMMFDIISYAKRHGKDNDDDDSTPPTTATDDMD